MKNLSFVFFIIILLYLCPTFSYGQGEHEMFIPQLGPSEYLNDVIQGDTLSNGQRADSLRIYVLQRGAIYLVRTQIRNTNWWLRVKGHDSTGARPVIYLTRNTVTSANPGRMVDIRGDVWMKNIVLAGWLEPDPTQITNINGALFTILSASPTSGWDIVFDSCVFSNTSGQHIRTERAPGVVKVTNCIFANMGYCGTSNLGAGKGIDLRDGSCDSLIFVNNTFVNFQDRIIRHFQSTAAIKYMLFDHNTIINGMSYHGMFSLGRVGNQVIFTNNLLIDAFALGNDSDAVRQLEFTDHGELDQFGKARMTWIFSNPNTTTDWTISNNYYSVSAAGQEFWDSASVRPIIADPALTEGSPLTWHINKKLGADSATAFTKELVTLSNIPPLMVNFMRWYRRPLLDIDSGSGKTKTTTRFSRTFDFDRRPLGYFTDTLDCDYSTGAGAYSGGEGGFPAGDLNWFPSQKAVWEQWVVENSTVEFQCNMKILLQEGDFNPVTDTLFVSGDFNNWGSVSKMTDPDVDSIYTFTLADTAGKTLAFKFQYYDFSATASVWEGVANRTHYIPTNKSTYYAWFNNDSTEKHNIEFTFSCNMELERLSGRFDPATDTVSVNGDFNSWTAKTTILTPNPLNPDLYEVTTTIRRGVGSHIYFKFWYTENNWESVDNRDYLFTQDDINALAASYSASFNNGTLDNVINQACDITFTVDTRGARSAISGNPFPVVNTCKIAGSATPLQWPGGGWPDADSLRMINLFDDGTNGDAVVGDSIFSGIVTFPAYTPLSVQYKYGINWGDITNYEGGNDNENGFGVNHLLHMTKYMTQATTHDIFGTMGMSMLGQSQVLQAGWNMISLPYAVADNRKTTLYPDAVSPAYYYDGTYQEEDSLINGVGYWLKSASVDTVTLIGADILTETIPVVFGWNMIGSIAQPIAVASITSNPSGMITTEFFGYTNSYVPTDTIFPGKAYWVKTSDAGTLTLTSPTLAGAVAKQAIRIVPTNELPPGAPENMISSTKNIPVEFAIEKAYPNPFNPVTRFRYDVPKLAEVQIAIYNVLGQKVKTLLNSETAPGSYEMEWDGTDGKGLSVPTGIYFVRMSADDFKAAQKVMLLK